MTAPTPEQIAACMEEATAVLDEWLSSVNNRTGQPAIWFVARALATRDAELAALWKFARSIATIVATPGEESVGDIITLANLPDLAATVRETIEHRDGRVADLSAKLHELERVHRDTERERVRLDAEIATLRANLATAHRERDEARKLLAECTILSGDDTDGNTIENGGWVHLWSHAVGAVRQLRKDYDEALDAIPTPASAFKVGDRVTAENVGALPVGAVATWGRHWFTRATKTDHGWSVAQGWSIDPDVLAADPPAYIHSLPTPEKP